MNIESDLIELHALGLTMRLPLLDCQDNFAGLGSIGLVTRVEKGERKPNLRYCINICSGSLFIYVPTTPYFGHI